jgi:hypothetical protein
MVAPPVQCLGSGGLCWWSLSMTGAYFCLPSLPAWQLPARSVVSSPDVSTAFLSGNRVLIESTSRNTMCATIRIRPSAPRSD